MVSIFIDHHLDVCWMFRHRMQPSGGNHIDSNNRFPFQILNAVEFEVQRRGDPRRSAYDTVRNNLDRGAFGRGNSRPLWTVKRKLRATRNSSECDSAISRRLQNQGWSDRCIETYSGCPTLQRVGV